MKQLADPVCIIVACVHVSWGVDGPYGQSVCSVPQTSPAELHTSAPNANIWHWVSCSSDWNKRPLKERSNGSFEKHWVRLQALRPKKGAVSQRRGKKMSELSEQVQNMWVTGKTKEHRVWDWYGQRFLGMRYWGSAVACAECPKKTFSQKTN